VISASTLDCITSRVDSDKVNIFGIQKCGSGTLTEYHKDDPRIDWNPHGTFFNKTVRDAIIKSFGRSQHPGTSAVMERSMIRTNIMTATRSYALSPTRLNVAMVRNPYDLLVSFYFHGLSGSNNIAQLYERPPYQSSEAGFKKFIMSFDHDGINHPFIPFILSLFYPYYAMGDPESEGKFMPDFAFKLEYLTDVIHHLNVWGTERHREVADTLRSHNSSRPRTPGGPPGRHSGRADRTGLPKNIIGPKTNVEMYDDHMASIVAHFFKYELDIFGYDIGGPSDDRVFIPSCDIPNLDDGRIMNFKTVIGV